MRVPILFSDVLDHILACCEHSSLFVSKNAKQLVAKILIHRLIEQEEPKAEAVDKHKNDDWSFQILVKRIGGEISNVFEVSTCVDIMHEFLVLCDMDKSTALTKLQQHDGFIYVYMQWIRTGFVLAERVFPSLTICVKLR